MLSRKIFQTSDLRPRTSNYPVESRGYPFGTMLGCGHLNHARYSTAAIVYVPIVFIYLAADSNFRPVNIFAYCRSTSMDNLTHMHWTVKSSGQTQFFWFTVKLIFSNWRSVWITNLNLADDWQNNFWWNVVNSQFFVNNRLWSDNNYSMSTNLFTINPANLISIQT